MPNDTPGRLVVRLKRWLGLAPPEDGRCTWRYHRSTSGTSGGAAYEWRWEWRCDYAWGHKGNHYSKEPEASDERAD